MTDQLAIINTFILYIGLMMAICVYYYRLTRNMSDYFLGNRKLGAWVTSMSAEASAMSCWMLMGVPGFAYLLPCHTLPCLSLPCLSLPRRYFSLLCLCVTFPCYAVQLIAAAMQFSAVASAFHCRTTPLLL